MKITEELWKETLIILQQEQSREDIDAGLFGLKRFNNLMNRGADPVEAQMLSADYASLLEKFSSAEKLALSSYFTGDLSKKYNLVGGCKRIFEFSKIGILLTDGPGRRINGLGVEIDLNKNFKTKETILFGDNLVISLIPLLGVLVPARFYFTQDSEETVCDILNDITEEIKKINDLGNSKCKEYNIKILVSSYGDNLRAETASIELVDDIDVNLNFNEDLPNNIVVDFLNKDKSGIVIFNGSPGCGKSSYIKYLIYNNPNIEFVLVPPSLVMSKPEGFRSYLRSRLADDVDRPEKRRKKNNRVYVLEDCEKLILSREKSLEGNSSLISDLLNYTDGILGDLTSSKFILTYNTDTSKIDEALLRKGRLKLRYEFKPLKGERLIKLCEKINYPLTEKQKQAGLSLAEIFNPDNIDFSKNTNKTPIGF